MGYEAACTLRFGGETVRGTAWLEHKDLVFRGPTRLRIPLIRITSATASGPTLRIAFEGKSAEFEIGEAAAKWAARIANPPSRLDKLGVKAGMRVRLVGAVDEPFIDELQARGAIVSTSRSAKPLSDIVFLGATTRDALARLGSLKDGIQPDGAIWVVRPKGQKTITEADTMAAGKRAGLVDVKVVSFSETHTAEKFVIPVAKRGAAKRTHR
jgi:hypothetical protein